MNTKKLATLSTLAGGVLLIHLIAYAGVVKSGDESLVGLVKSRMLSKLKNADFICRTVSG